MKEKFKAEQHSHGDVDRVGS